MKKLSCIVALMLALMLAIASVPAFAATDISIDEEHFPDRIFREYVTRFDDGNCILTQAERDKVTRITVACEYDEEEDSETPITSLKGIEYFPKLKYLSVEGFYGSVDLSSNKALTSVSIQWGGLTSVNLKKNTKLTKLYLRDNSLTSINLAKNVKLKYLDLAENNLKSLNISKNKALTFLDCGRNNLKKLNVKKNTKLKYLVCNQNKLSSLDVSKNTKLAGLAVFGNPKLKKLDIAKCKSLQKAVKKKKLQTTDLPEGVRCWGTYFENEMIEGLAISPFTKVTAGKKTLYKGK